MLALGMSNERQHLERFPVRPVGVRWVRLPGVAYVQGPVVVTSDKRVSNLRIESSSIQGAASNGAIGLLAPSLVLIPRRRRAVGRWSPTALN